MSVVGVLFFWGLFAFIVAYVVMEFTGHLDRVSFLTGKTGRKVMIFFVLLILWAFIGGLFPGSVTFSRI